MPAPEDFSTPSRNSPLSMKTKSFVERFAGAAAAAEHAANTSMPAKTNRLASNLKARARAR
jgi:hypothetical protein